MLQKGIFRKPLNISHPLFCLYNFYIPLRIVCFPIYTWHNIMTSAPSKFIRSIFNSRTFISHLSVTPKKVPKSLILFRIPLSRCVCSTLSNYRVPQHLREYLLTIHKLFQTHWKLKATKCLLWRVNHFNWKLILKFQVCVRLYEKRLQRYSESANNTKLRQCPCSSDNMSCLSSHLNEFHQIQFQANPMASKNCLLSTTV